MLLYLTIPRGTFANDLWLRFQVSTTIHGVWTSLSSHGDKVLALDSSWRTTYYRIMNTASELHRSTSQPCAGTSTRVSWPHVGWGYKYDSVQLTCLYPGEMEPTTLTTTNPMNASASQQLGYVTLVSRDPTRSGPTCWCEDLLALKLVPPADERDFGSCVMVTTGWMRDYGCSSWSDLLTCRDGE